MKTSVIRRVISASRTRGVSKAQATASRVRSSSVGPSPPVTITTGAASTAARTMPPIRRTSSSTRAAHDVSMPSSARRAISHSALVSGRPARRSSLPIARTTACRSVVIALDSLTAPSYDPARMRAPLTSLSILAFVLYAGCSQSGPRPEPRFEGRFGEKLRSADPARRFVALIDLTEQIDPRALARQLTDAKAGKSDTRAQVVAAYETLAARQQARLRPLLDRLIAAGSITYARPVAIVNRVIVEGTAEGLSALARSDEVALVRPDWTSERGAAAGREWDPAAPLPASFKSWAIDAMNVPQMWELGYDGTGIVVATIDTGAFEGHEQLCCRRVPGERGWFDPVEGSSVPHDRHGHGTGVLSQAVGGNPDGRVLGVAPAATWASALGNWNNFYVRSRMTLAADWVLRVARPDIVINAWSHEEGACNEFDRPFIDAWRASGSFVVFPAGNGGPKPATGESPAQLRGIFSVTALAEPGKSNRIASRGPSRCGSDEFPTLAAPGVDLPMAALGSAKAYLRGEGTSLSAGLVGGAAALLLQAEPDTDPETLERALVAGARDVLPPGRDDVSGAGAIDVTAALAILRGRKPTYR